MAKKNDKKKKGEGDLEREMKQALLIDIELLENKIYYEQEKDLQARKEIETINKDLTQEHEGIEKIKNEEGRKINSETKQMEQQIDDYITKVNNLEKILREQDDEIRSLYKAIEDRSEENRKQLEEKDTHINEQRKLFEDMSVRFQHILQRTANKLQERVNMGS